MLSFTGRRNLYGTLTQNSTTGNLTVGDTLMNSADKQILSLYQWPFLETSDTVTTVALTQFVKIPQKIGKLETITITHNSIVYTPKRINSEYEWAVINQTSQTSDVPQYVYERAGQVGIFPTPLAGGATVTFYGRKVQKDLSIADYTTGTITSIANGGTAVVGSGTSWTAKMAGRFIKITDSNTANTGDGEWYEVASSGSATSITLNRPYAGTAISAGTAAYTLGQMAPYPEGYHELPVYNAVRTYYASIEREVSKYQEYDRIYKDLESRLISDFALKQGDTLGLKAEYINFE